MRTAETHRVKRNSSGVSKIFSSNKAFAALKEDGSIVTWGAPYADFSHDPRAVALLSSGVKKVFSSNGSSFAALKTDKSVVIWGEKLAYGDDTKYSFINSDVNEIHPNQYGYALSKTTALKSSKRKASRRLTVNLQVVASDRSFAYIR